MATIRCQTQVFENIQAVIFDKDGTLANSESLLRSLAQHRARLIDAKIPGVQEPLLMAFGVNGDQIDPAGLMAVGTRLENEIAAAAYVSETGRGWADSLQLVRSAFKEAENGLRKAERTPLIAGGLELIQRLTQAKVQLAILSSDSSANVQEFVQVAGLKDYFSVVYGVNEQFSTKTNPQLLQQLLEDLSPPHQTLMIGDAQIDAEIAKDAKLAGCIGFTGGWKSRFTINGATVSTNQFSEIQVLD